MHRRGFSSIWDLHPLEMTLLRQSEVSLDIAQCPLGGKYHPWLRTMALEAKGVRADSAVQSLFPPRNHSPLGTSQSSQDRRAELGRKKVAGGGAVTAWGKWEDGWGPQLKRG